MRTKIPFIYQFTATQHLPSKPVAVQLAHPERLIAANDDDWIPPKQFA